MPHRQTPPYLRALLTFAIAAAPLWASAADSAQTRLCGIEPMPKLDERYAQYDLHCALDLRVAPGGDVTDALKNALSLIHRESVRRQERTFQAVLRAYQENPPPESFPGEKRPQEQPSPLAARAILFLPAGVYHINSDIWIEQGIGLMGSQKDMTQIVTKDRPAVLAMKGGLDPQAHWSIVQNLYLKDVRIDARDDGRVEVRNNAFLGTRESRAQLYLRGRGSRIVEGNVFVRGPAHPGDGILISGWRGSRANSGHHTLIRDNLLGAVSSQQETSLPKAVRQIAKNAFAAEDPRSQGHYSSMLIIFSASNVTIENNAMAPGLSSSGRVALERIRDLKILGNSFKGWKPLEISIRNPSTATIDGNLFENSMLRFTGAREFPTKNTVVSRNVFRGGRIDVDVAVNGAGEAHTSPDDLKMIDNVMMKDSDGTAPTCFYSLRKPQVGTTNFHVTPGSSLVLRNILYPADFTDLCRPDVTSIEAG